MRWGICAAQCKIHTVLDMGPRGACMQSAQETTAAAAAAAVVREATASAAAEVLDNSTASAEEKAVRLAAAKEEKMRKVIRWAVSTRRTSAMTGSCDGVELLAGRVAGMCASLCFTLKPSNLNGAGCNMQGMSATA